MKTQNINNKMRFNKTSLVELNNSEIIEINGGSTIVGGPTCTGCVCDDVNNDLKKFLVDKGL